MEGFCDLLRVSIPGDPQGQPRGRAFTKHLKGCGFHRPSRVTGGRICTLGCNQIGIHSNSKKSEGAKKTTSGAMLAAKMKANLGVLAGPLRIELNCFFSWTKEREKELKLLADVPAMPHTKKPDCDNVAKLYLDAGNGLLWLDDAHIFSLDVKKWHAPKIGGAVQAPCVEMIVQRLR